MAWHRYTLTDPAYGWTVELDRALERALGWRLWTAPTARLKVGLAIVWDGDPDPEACRALGGLLEPVEGPPRPWTHPDPAFDNAWVSYRHAVEAVAPEAVRRLRPPAAADDVQVLRAHHDVPDPLLAFLARHDGEEDGLDGGILPTWRPLSVVEILQAKQALDELHAGSAASGRPVGPTHAAWWHPGWLPCASNGGGDHLVVDRAPPSGGRPGQVVLFDHADGRREVVAGSLPEALRQMTEGLMDGSVHALEEHDGRFAGLGCAGDHVPDGLRVRPYPTPGPTRG